MGASDPFWFLPPPLLPREGWVGSRAGCCQPWSWVVTQGSLRKLERRTQLHQLVLGKQLQMMKFFYMPTIPQTPTVPTKSRAHSPVCLSATLLAAWGCRPIHPPPPHPHPLFGTLASSGGSPAAFILICFLCDNSVWGILIALPLHWALFLSGLGPTSPGCSAPSLRPCQYQGAEERVAAFMGTSTLTGVTHPCVLSPVLGVKFNGQGADLKRKLI